MSQDFDGKLKTLRRRRYFTEQNINTSKERLKHAKNEEEYKQISDHIKTLEISAADIVDKIEKLEGPTTWRAEQLAEVNKYGFSVTGHAVQQYNMRFKPYLIKEQLMEFLAKVGLKEKINGEPHQLINLKPNFWVAVEHKIVTTVKYDSDYYKGPETPRFDLGAI
jgi:hypothetical protein